MKRWKKWTVLIVSACCLIHSNILPVMAEDYWPDGPEITGESAVVMEASTGTILYEKNPHEKNYPASITKIMTTLLALENCSLSESVTFSNDSVHSIDRDSTHISRDVGEIMTMEQCLYAVMLASANECAYAVAEHAGKGIDNFVKMMNKKAKEIGCKDTNFNNPHGLQDENHYTSAYDMALISREALKNETFRFITGTKKYTIPFTNKHTNEETPMVNHHKMLAPYKGDATKLYEYCIGGKTGYTDMARSTLVTFAEKDDMTLICVVMKEDGNTQYTDTRALMDYCFENFRLWNVSENENRNVAQGSANMEIFENSEKFLDLAKDSRIILPKAAAFQDAASEINLRKVSKDVVAALDYTYAGRVVGSAQIKVTGAKVQQYPFQVSSNDENADKAVHVIEVKNILIVLAAILGIILLGFLIFRIVSNFYLIRYRHQSRSVGRSRARSMRASKRRKRNYRSRH